MTAQSRLGRQLQEVLAGLERIGASTALIGGLALAPHNVVRATQDIDLLADANEAESIDRELVALGYACVHRSPDAANYLRGDERIDLLFAHRQAARRLLAQAISRNTPFGRLQVISLEGLIAFKLQGYVNDPRRGQDLEDIRALLRANRDVVNVAEVRDYFRLFEREACSMKSLQSKPDDRATRDRPALLIADGGAPAAAARGEDPFVALDDLMQVVEALLPTWPRRECFGPMPELRL